MRSTCVLSFLAIVVGCGCGGITSGSTASDASVDSPTAETTPPISAEIPDKHRQVATACPPTPATVACMKDTDCSGFGTGASPKCVDGLCATDACLVDGDCTSTGGHEVCACKGATRGWGGSSAGNACVSGNCSVDADCGVGQYCVPSFGDCGPFYGVQGYHCTTPADACRNDRDCGDSGLGSNWCGYDTTAGKWTCMSGGCAG